MQKNVIVIGGGCAGMTAALEAEANGANVLLLARGPIGIGTNSALSNGIFAGPNPNCNLEEYITETLKTGKGLNSIKAIRLIANQAPQAFSYLRSLGLELEEISGRYIIKSPRPDIIPGHTLVKSFVEKVKNCSRINVMTGVYVTEILKDGERVCGVKGFNREGGELLVSGGAVVLATGGAAAIFLRNDNQKTIMGQGYYLAARAGLELWDMEFVQFFPLTIAEPGFPSIAVFSPHPKNTRLINEAGEDLLQKYGIDDLNQIIKTKRDEFSAILFRESMRGPIYMDYRHAPKHLWEKHPLSLLKRIRFDFQNRPFSISPSAHFFMGGVRIDENGQTALPGLFACGEVVWGLHGANRMAGNALTETIVSGRIAGRNAALYALTHRPFTSKPKGLMNEFLYPIFPPKVELPNIRKKIREIAWECAGIVRSDERMKQGLSILLNLEKELKAIVPKTFNERRLKEDLASAAFVLRAVLIASIPRQETRGAFIREDFPHQNDLKWRKNSCLAYNPQEDNFSLNHYPPIIERLS